MRAQKPIAAAYMSFGGCTADESAFYKAEKSSGARWSRVEAEALALAPKLVKEHSRLMQRLLGRVARAKDGTTRQRLEITWLAPNGRVSRVRYIWPQKGGEALMRALRTPDI